jgi:hypothetical protein
MIVDKRCCKVISNLAQARGKVRVCFDSIGYNVVQQTMYKIVRALVARMRHACLPFPTTGVSNIMLAGNPTRFILVLLDGRCLLRKEFELKIGLPPCIKVVT